MRSASLAAVVAAAALLATACGSPATTAPEPSPDQVATTSSSSTPAPTPASPAPVESASDPGAVAEDKDPVGFVGYDRVRVEEEEDASGDEVIVAVLKIKSTTGVPDSTKWAWVTKDPAPADDVDEGDEADIPDSAGDAWFEGDLAVQPFSWWQLSDDSNMLTTDVMVTIAFLLEDDAGDISDDVDMIDGLIKPIVEKVGDTIEGAQIPVNKNTFKDSAKAEKALNDLMGKLSDLSPDAGWGTLGDLIGRYFVSVGDPNDIIGVAMTAFVPTEETLYKTLAEQKVTPKDLNLLGPGEGDGNQAWTNYKTWEWSFPWLNPNTGARDDLELKGEVWYGLLSEKWVDDWMKVESNFPWQDRVVWWLKVTASMRPPR